MSIIVCRVTTARDHENADRLRVYTVEAPGVVEPTQVIANKDRVYEVGDVVLAALIGTTLQDGTVIEKAKVRGVLSFGMLLGTTNDAPVGTDLTLQVGATHVEKQVDESQGVVEDSAWPRYTSLDGFLRVRDEIMACPEVVVTEKLHGCLDVNTLVMLPNGEEVPIRTVISDPDITHVLTYDEKTQSFRPGLITGKRRLPNTHSLPWMRITLENGREVTCTTDHPFYSRDRKRYVRADDIAEGEDIETPNE